MNHPFLSSIWVRIAVFAWLFVFPLVFIAIPLAEMFTGENDETVMPVWALVVWMLGPAVVSIGMKYFGGNDLPDETENDGPKGQGKKNKKNA